MLAIDVGEEMRTPWDSRKPAAADRLTVVMTALVQFVKAKSALNPRHLASGSRCSATTRTPSSSARRT